MEKEQLEKKVTWLDQERRKASEIIAEQEKRLAALEKALAKEKQGIKALDKQSTSLAALPEKFDEFERQLKVFVLILTFLRISLKLILKHKIVIIHFSSIYYWLNDGELLDLMIIYFRKRATCRF